MLDKIKNYLILLLLLTIGVLLAAGAIKKSAYDKQVVILQNQAAAQAKTIEDQKGLFEKLALQETNVQSMLDTTNAQVKELQSQLKKSNEDLASAVEVTLQLKAQNADLKLASGAQTTVPSTVKGQPDRTKVAFDKDFGTVKVDGFTLTNPPEANISLLPSTPLKLTVALSQDKTKVWHAYATSSDPNIGVNIDLAAVNPYIEAPKWYENIGVDADAAVGTGGVLGGLGLSYKFGKFEAGPKVFATVTDKADVFYGAGFVWHPFASQ
ncbi:MAG: hypothetical protein ACYDHY_07605 [Acidiferrobacterales bacterium]